MATISQTRSTRYNSLSYRRSGAQNGFAEIDLYYSYTKFDNVVGATSGDFNSALILLEPFTYSGQAQKITLMMTVACSYGSVNTFRWHLCTSRANEDAYKTPGQKSGKDQIGTGTFTVSNTGGKASTVTLELTTSNVPANVPLYLYLSGESAGQQANFHFRGNIDVTLYYGVSGRTTPDVSFSGNMTLGATLTVTLSNAKPDWITSVYFNIPNGTDDVLIAKVVGNGSFSWTTLESYAQYIQPGRKTLQINFLIESTYSGMKFASATSITMNPPQNLGATVTTSAYNAGTGISSSQKFVKSISRIYASAEMINLYGASVESMKFSGSGGSYVLYASSGYSPAPISVSGAVHYVVTITDSWGRTAQAEFDISVYDYSPPSIGNQKATKYSTDPAVFDPHGTNIAIFLSAVCTPLDGENNCTVRYRIKSATGDWGNYVVLSSGTSGGNFTAQIHGITDNTAYQVELNVFDTAERSVTSILYVPPDLEVPLHIMRDKCGIGAEAVIQYALTLNEAWEFYYKGSPILQKIYPVGSIYMSVNSTDPGVLFGGTWERIQDAFLLGAGSHAAGSTGGSETVTLTVDQIPTHSHGIEGALRWPEIGSGESYDGWGNRESYYNEQINATANSGGGQSHNNMPPYLAVYMWKRTA